MAGATYISSDIFTEEYNTKRSEELNAVWTLSVFRVSYRLTSVHAIRTAKRSVCGCLNISLCDFYVYVGLCFIGCEVTIAMQEKTLYRYQTTWQPAVIEFVKILAKSTARRLVLTSNITHSSYTNNETASLQWHYMYDSGSNN
jgi:hypothetical protein